MGKLEGKVAVITGGNSGIGLSIYVSAKRGLGDVQLLGSCPKTSLLSNLEDVPEMKKIGKVIHVLGPGLKKIKTAVVDTVRLLSATVPKLMSIRNSLSPLRLLITYLRMSPVGHRG